MADWWWDILYLSRYLPDLLAGLRMTLEVSVLALVLGLAIGLVGAAMRQSRVWLFRLVAGAYVEVIRNTPTLVQIFLIYFGLPSLGLTLTNYQAGVIALGVSGGGYFIEIIRAGFVAIPAGQREASVSLGLSKASSYVFVLLPQAIRIVYPPVVGQYIQMILGSSMLSIIGVAELTGEAQILNAATYRTIPVFLIALGLYLILTNLVSGIANLIGRHAFRPPLQVSRRTVRLSRLAILNRRGDHS